MSLLFPTPVSQIFSAFLDNFWALVFLNLSTSRPKIPDIPFRPTLLFLSGSGSHFAFQTLSFLQFVSLSFADHPRYHARDVQVTADGRPAIASFTWRSRCSAGPDAPLFLALNPRRPVCATRANRSPYFSTTNPKRISKPPWPTAILLIPAPFCASCLRPHLHPPWLQQWSTRVLSKVGRRARGSPTPGAVRRFLSLSHWSCAQSSGRWAQGEGEVARRKSARPPSASFFPFPPSPLQCKAAS